MPTLTQLFAAPTLALGLAFLSPAPLVAEVPLTSAIAAESLPKGKQTAPALYITAAEAADVLAQREDVLLIDVRTPEETLLVGVPDVADVNIPFAMFSPDYSYNAKKSSYDMTPNPNFVGAVKTYLGSQEPAAVLVMCRSGGRSAKAVNTLAKAGIDLPLYSVVDGFEGDKDKAGYRTLNGWKNAGAAWSTKIPADFLQGVD